MGDADYNYKWDVEAEGTAYEAFPRAWHVTTTFIFCLAKIAGKYAAYPEVDAATFDRLHAALTRGINRRKTAGSLGDFCQELRSVANCPPAELLTPEGADEADSRLNAIAHVVRRHAALDATTFRELLRALLAWNPPDKALILKALLAIIRE